MSSQELLLGGLQNTCYPAVKSGVNSPSPAPAKRRRSKGCTQAPRSGRGRVIRQNFPREDGVWILFFGTRGNGMSTVLSHLQFRQSSSDPPSIAAATNRSSADNLGHDLSLMDDLMFSTGINLFIL